LVPIVGSPSFLQIGPRKHEHKPVRHRQRAGAEIANWFVDSVNGNDANSGKSPSQAFRTIAQLESVWVAGESVALARGSHWREQMDVPGIGCPIFAYGTGNRPLLDASDVITAGQWSKTAGRTNVYECSITPNWVGAGKDYVNVYEDGINMVRVANIATCDTTPDSYVLSAEGAGTVTLYVHTEGSDNPATNGSTYEYTQRRYGLTGRSYACTITSVHTQRNLHEDGSLEVGKNSALNDCWATDGSAHNFLTEDGTTLTDCVAHNAYWTEGVGAMFVYYSAVGEGLGTTYTDCTTSADDLLRGGEGGFYGHCGIGGMGDVVHDGCTCENLWTGITVAGNTPNSLIRDCTFTNCGRAILVNGSTVTIEGTNPVTNDGSVHPFDRVMTIQAAVTVDIDDLIINLTNTTTGILWQITQAATVTINNCEITNPSTSGCNGLVIQHAGANVTLGQNTWWSLTWRVYDWFVAPTWASNNNIFCNANFPFRIGGVSYGTVALYQAGTGQDAGSQVGGC